MATLTLPKPWNPAGLLRRLPGAAGWATAWGLSWLIIFNTLPYFTFAPHFAFLIEKGAVAGDPAWRLAFFAHITGGMLCLAVGPLLFSARLAGRAPGAHRWIGRAYALAVLGWAGPSGLYLSFFAKGGMLGRFCFVLQVAAWWTATLWGVRAILQQRVPDHMRWMIRSYALALSAVYFRISQVALNYGLGVDDHVNYSISLWTSLAASLVTGEWRIRRRGLAPRPAVHGGAA